MPRHIFAIFSLCALTTVFASEQQLFYLAYVQPERQFTSRVPQLNQAGCVFMGSYEAGRFAKAPEISESNPDIELAVRRILGAFPYRQQLTGVDRRGRLVKATVESANPDNINDIGEVTLRVHIQGGTTPLDGALLTTKPIAIRVLRRESVHLPSAVNIMLRQRAKELWIKHLPEQSIYHQSSRYTLKPPLVERIEGVPGVLTVLYPMDIEEDNLYGDGQNVHDNRGSMFFIYSEADHKVIRGEFGHPEWSSDSTVWTIKPELYFRISTSSDVFFVGVSEGGWESIGHGMFDLRTGREVLSCY